MKLNENGDFCLLYVEQTDDKQSLFEMIALQNKTVILMLPLVAGQFRTRLFQRPEDFSDLKHLKRQTGVSVIFLTSGSELLAQMATRYGFSAYPSIDTFAEVLARGKRVDAEEGGQPQSHSARAPRARTGPLVPSAAQIAAIKRAMPNGPLPKRSIPIGPLPPSVPTPEMAWSGPVSAAAPLDYADFVSMSRSPTSPLHEPLDLGFWATPESIAMSEAQSQGTSSFAANRDMTPLPRGVTPVPRGRESDHLPSASLTREPFFATTEEAQYQAPHFSEAPARRSSTLAREPYTPHPAWEPEEQQFTDATETLAHRSQTTTRNAGTSALHHAPERPRTPAPVEPQAPKNTPQKRGMMPVLIILSILILGGAALGSLVAFAHTAPPTAPVATTQPAGTIMFVSSGQLNENTSQGIDDEVQITLHNLSNPRPGKSYYAWLLGDATQAESQSVLLGKLNFTRGSVNFLYPGDPQHTNLLQIGSRFLITAEDSAITPLLPSPDKATWLYYGSIPAIPDPNDPHHFSFLNHLRHLLADEPILDELELPGGLNSWFTRNTQKLIEFTSNARDHWQDTQDMVFVRNEAIRILSYLDGMSFMVQDMPQASLNTQVNLDTHLAGLGLVNVRGATQSPGSYMDQITYHLNGLLNAPGSPANVRGVASAILPAMSDVNTWLQQLRTDDKQLLAMDDMQIAQPAAFTLLNDMVVQASNAYSGNADPATGQFKQGVVWIHEQLQSLATINIGTFVQGSNAPGLVPAPNTHLPAFLLSQVAEWKFLEGLL